MGKKIVGLTMPLVVALTVFITASTLPEVQRWCATIFSWAIVAWILQSLPLWLTSALASLSLILTGTLSLRVVAGAFLDPIIFLFIGSFIIARALEISGLHRRIALYFLSQPTWVSTRGRLLGVVALITCGLSLIMSNTAVTAIMLPIGLSLLNDLKISPHSSLRRAVLLMLTWGSSVAVGFLIGTPPNLIVQEEIARGTGVHIGFVHWMVFGMPLTALLLSIAWVILTFSCRNSEDIHLHNLKVVKQQRDEMAKPTLPELWTMGILVAVIFFWMLPELAAVVLGPHHPVALLLLRHMTPASVACIGALVMGAIVPNKTELKDHLTDLLNIRWGSIVLFGGGIALGRGSLETGLAYSIGTLFQSSLADSNLLVITLFATLFGTLLSELTSNTAAAAIGVPLVFGIAQQIGLNPIPPSLGLAIGSSLGFMMPVSTPPNSIVFSSGAISAKDMMKYGAVLDILGALGTVLVLRLTLPWLGWW